MFDLGFSGLLAGGTILLAPGDLPVEIGISNIFLQVAILLFSVLMVAFFSSAEAKLDLGQPGKNQLPGGAE